jgi:mRNA-degrading endonuclease RelE of RelBE toxin-antitoxin system
MEFIEVPSFTPRVTRYLGEEEYGRLQIHLTQRPDAGAIISGSRGLRKLRWAAKGHGKRGGVRIIYYWHVTPEIITLLDIYPKNEKDDLTTDEIRLLNLLLED